MNFRVLGSCEAVDHNASSRVAELTSPGGKVGRLSNHVKGPPLSQEGLLAELRHKEKPSPKTKRKTSRYGSGREGEI